MIEGDGLLTLGSRCHSWCLAHRKYPGGLCIMLYQLFLVPILQMRKWKLQGKPKVTQLVSRKAMIRVLFECLTSGLSILLHGFDPVWVKLVNRNSFRKKCTWLYQWLFCLAGAQCLLNGGMIDFNENYTNIFTYNFHAFQTVEGTDQ